MMFNKDLTAIMTISNQLSPILCTMHLFHSSFTSSSYWYWTLASNLTYV